MEAYRIDRFGSVDGIVLRSSEDPQPGPKEILMRIRASSPNYRDLMVLKGGGRGPTKIGVVPLSDGAGEVAAIGDGVTRFNIGDRIAGCFHPRWFGGPIKPDYLTDRLGANLDGVLAEYAVFNEEAVVTLPNRLSFEEAATLPCAAVTAWVALTGHRRVAAGDTVLTGIALPCGSSAFPIGSVTAVWHYRAKHKARQLAAARASGLAHRVHFRMRAG
jgi:NADPH:quinone reductase-like Zn-dependent oxidoreductase